jgi:hypothetical protein
LGVLAYVNVGHLKVNKGLNTFLYSHITGRYIAYGGKLVHYIYEYIREYSNGSWRSRLSRCKTQLSGSGYSLQVFLGVGVKPRAPLFDQLKIVGCTRYNPTPCTFINCNSCYKLARPITLWQSLACPLVEKRDFCGKARDVSSTGDSRKGESRSAGMHLL